MDTTPGAGATSVGAADQALVITSAFGAPRSLVFRTVPPAEREMCRQGSAESLDRLAAHLRTA